MEFINAPIGTKLNEIIESKDSQAYHASHSDLNDCVIRDLGSLDENTSKKSNEILESEDSQASIWGSLDIKTDEN
ncbi:unnamed protein product [Rhizophagus irregularis]|nr:unnamed protein product [Rhizophagus irregularis]